MLEVRAEVSVGDLSVVGFADIVKSKNELRQKKNGS
jgi:hypothetical protein